MPSEQRAMKIFHYTKPAYEGYVEHCFVASRLFFSARQLQQAQVKEVEVQPRLRRIARRERDARGIEVNVPYYALNVFSTGKGKVIELSHAFPYPSARKQKPHGVIAKKVGGLAAGGRGLGVVFHLKALQYLAQQHSLETPISLYQPSSEYKYFMDKAGLDWREEHTLGEHIEAFSKLSTKNAARPRKKHLLLWIAKKFFPNYARKKLRARM